MITTFALLCDRCGLSTREAADHLDVRLDTIKSWSSGRNRTPPTVLAELRALYGRIEAAAGEALARIATLPPGSVVELGLAADDHEAQALGWPCVGAQAAMLGLVAARTEQQVLVVPRGTTPATAAAADAHDQALAARAPR